MRKFLSIVTTITLGFALIACAAESQDSDQGALEALTLLSLNGQDTGGDPEIADFLLNVLSSAAGWSYYGSNVARNDNGECNGVCTKGNYNINWERSLCYAGKTPGQGATTFYRGRITVNGKTWDKVGGQDHEGVCIRANTTNSGYYFHDGCTGYPPGNPPAYNNGALSGTNHNNWGKVFHGACVMHDLCYQNEPRRSGTSRAGCDNVFYQYALDICDAAFKNEKWSFRNPFPELRRTRCKAVALTARSLMTFGTKDHYNKYDFGQGWRPADLCPGSQKYDVYRNQCR